MVSQALTAIQRELTHFFAARARDPSVITSRSNVRSLCGFSDDPVRWRALARQINRLPHVMDAGLRITPADMGEVSTIADIIEKLLASSSLVVGKSKISGTSKRKTKIGSSVTAGKQTSRGGADDRHLRQTRIEPHEARRKDPSAITSKPGERGDAEYMVWYGTNRAPNDRENVSKGFSKRRDTRTHYGTCRVFIPKSHKIGSTGSPILERILTWTDDRLRLIETKELAPVVYWETIASHLRTLSTDEREAVIFVHGYNVSFVDAALRAAQIGFDLSIRGAMAFFSWPSQGTIRGYVNDEATIEASELPITEFMVEVAEKSGASKVHVIAHSMGNRGVLRAVDRIASRAQRRTGILFDQIILAAADVDAGTFRSFCAAYTKLSNRTTLYVSSADRAVGASRWLHAFPRAGLIPPVTVVPGIDTINVTNVDLTMLGHGYVAEARSVLEDMHRLITTGAPPEARFGLRESTTDEGEQFWLIGK